MWVPIMVGQHSGSMPGFVMRLNLDRVTYVSFGRLES